MHQLRLADIGLCKLRKINKMIRSNFKKFLHLPEWTPDSWMRLRGGGNLGDLTATILKSRKKASVKMTNSNEHSTAVIGATNQQLPDKDLSIAGYDGLEMRNIKSEVQLRAEQKLATTSNGQALLCIAKSHVKRDWLWYSKTIQGGDVVIAARMLSKTLPTPLNLTRGAQTRKNQM